MQDFKKKILATAVIGSVFSLSQTVTAQEVPSGMNVFERAAWVAIETGASLTAAVVAHGAPLGCSGSYTLDGVVQAIDQNNPGDDDDSTVGGDFSIGARSFNVDVETVPEDGTPGEQRGTGIAVRSTGGGSLGGVDVRRVRGEYRYDDETAIMTGATDFRLDGDDWSETIIKDFFVGELDVLNASDPDDDDATPTVGVLDEGLEVISKLEYPVSKWRQTSEYRKFNAVTGEFVVEKERVQFVGASTCFITMEGSIFPSLGGLRVTASVDVAPFNF